MLQIIFILVMPATVMVLMGALFGVLKLLGQLRVTEEEEDVRFFQEHLRNRALRL
jgi:ammonia channel protein AmtB